MGRLFGNRSALALGMLGATILLLASPTAAAGSWTASVSTCTTITSVSAINSSHLHKDIIIDGTCLGNGSPRLNPVLGGGFDTVACGSSSKWIQIVDHGNGSHSWSAGYQNCTSKDHIGLYFLHWRNGHIDLAGFGSGYLGHGSATKVWNIGPGDPLTITVKGTDGQSTYAVTAT